MTKIVHYFISLLHIMFNWPKCRFLFVNVPQLQLPRLSLILFFLKLFYEKSLLTKTAWKTTVVVEWSTIKAIQWMIFLTFVSFNFAQSQVATSIPVYFHSFCNDDLHLKSFYTLSSDCTYIEWMTGLLLKVFILNVAT